MICSWTRRGSASQTFAEGLDWVGVQYVPFDLVIFLSDPFAHKRFGDVDRQRLGAVLVALCECVHRGLGEWRVLEGTRR